MKRMLTVFAVICLIPALFGCGLIGNDAEDKALFYYSRLEYAYGSAESIIVAEQRDITGHAHDLKYLLSLYLMGPLDEELTSLFPGTTRIASTVLDENILTIELIAADKDMTESQFSLACACMSMTCLELTNAETVTIVSGERSITLSADDLLLFDDPIPTETLSEETQ